MIAKVVTENKEYYSYVFARFNPGYYETLIVFDNETERFELINVYNVKPSLKRKVFIIDTNTEGMIEEKIIKLSLKTNYKNCLGYDWVLHDIELIKKIKEGSLVDEKFIILAKQFNDNIVYNEWTLVKNKKDIQDLMTASWGFHDSELDNISYKLNEFGEPSVVQVLFTGCWECDILLEFKGDVLIHFNLDDRNTTEILDSNILFDNGYIYWIDDYIEDVKNISEENIYFRARSLKWKMINKKNNM